jgi:geranylgeranyl diphosphate synthase type II
MDKYTDIINNTINNHLKKYFKEKDPMFDICKYSLGNGKRIRPSISLDICKSLLDSTENVIFSCLIVEYLHTASLIIDDLPCMDNSLTRRNNPTTHVKYGEAITQLSSIVLLSLAVDSLNLNMSKILSNDSTNKGEITQIGLSIFSTLSKVLGSEGVAGGQLLDLAFTNKDVSNVYDKQIDLKEMILKKTGALFELSFIIGWLFGKGDANKLDKIRNISDNFSMIYQILDDIEDVQEDNPDKNKLTKNYVLTHGKYESIKSCYDFIKKFKEEMVELKIYSIYFKELMNYVEKKLYDYESIKDKLQLYTVHKLKILAKSKNITGYSKLRKNILIDKLDLIVTKLD